MNDRELLEMAALAAEIGPKLCYESARNCLRIGDRKSYWLWSPLSDDGDAMRLAVKLGLVVCVMKDAGLTGVYIPAEHIGGKYDAGETYYLTDPYAATRRAIVRAAAEIGQTMTTESVR